MVCLMKSLLFITYIILLNLFQGLAFNSSDNCTCNEAFNISWTGIRNAIFTPTPDPNGYFCLTLQCNWVFYNEITPHQVLILGLNISNNFSFPLEYRIDNCRDIAFTLNLLDKTLITTYTQESQICVYLSTANAISTENIYFKLSFQLQDERPNFLAFNLSDISSGLPPFRWIQLKSPSSQYQIVAYSFQASAYKLYGYIVTEYEHSFNNGLLLVYGGYKSLINYREYALWNGSSNNGGNGLFYSINTISYLSPAISLAYTTGSNQSDVYAFFAISELFQGCLLSDDATLPIQYAYPDNQTFILTFMWAYSTSLCYGLIVLPQSGRLLKFISFDLQQDFTIQVASFGYDSNSYYTLFEVDASTAEQYANSFVFAQLIVIMPGTAGITLSLNFEYVRNWNFVHNSTRGVVMSPNYPESWRGQISQFEIQCILCLENNAEGEFLIKLDYIDFGQKYYINISSDNVNYTLFYAFNETGLDLNQTHIFSGKTISIDYNTYWDATDISRGFLLSYEIRNPNLTTIVTSTITPDIPSSNTCLNGWHQSRLTSIWIAFICALLFITGKL